MGNSLVYLVPLALGLGGVALAAFFWSLRSGQYDDLDGAAERIFLDEEDYKAGGDEVTFVNAAHNSDKENTG